MTGCGRSGGKKPLGEGLQLALLEAWSTSASLRWETQRGKAGPVCSGKSGLQGYICIFRCGGEVGHHWHNRCLS